MSVNLPPKTPTINAWLKQASNQLEASGIKSGSLDAELILANTLRKDRTYLHAHNDEIILPRFLQIANARVALRGDRVPLAYILGYKDFYGRHFKVSPTVLVPRPETEQFIELLRRYVPKNLSLLPTNMELVDVGTGSGVIGITAKLEFPELSVTLLENDQYAINIATENAKKLKADVVITKSNLLTNYYKKANFILANLPYVDKDWEHLPPELNHEPPQALYADDRGLALIKKLIIQAKQKLAPGGYLFLECDSTQQSYLKRFSNDNGYKVIQTAGLITVLTSVRT